MKFGFDIDDTLNDVRYKAISLFNEELNVNITHEDVDKHESLSIHHAFNINETKRKEIWKTRVLDIYEGSKPLPYAAEFLNKLRKDGHEVFYITARSGSDVITKLTIDWLKENNFPFNENNFFIGMKDEEKYEIAVKSGIDIFVDDKPGVLKVFEEKQMINYLIKNQAYNLDF